MKAIQKNLTSALTSFRILLLTLIAMAILLCSCDTILQYPEGEGIDPTKPNVHLRLQIDPDMAILGEYEYDFENPPVLGRYTKAEIDSIYDGHLLRYTVNVYHAGDKGISPKPVISQSYTTPAPDYSWKDIELFLEPGDYRVVVWADYVEDGKLCDKHYDTSEFSGITLNNAGGHPGSDHLRDAFHGSATISVSEIVGTVTSEEIGLRRPMALYTFVSTDLEEFLRMEQSRKRETGLKSPSLDDYSVRIVYTQYMPCSYNAHTGKPCDSRLGAEYYSSISQIDGRNARLGFDYVFTNGSATSVAVAMEVVHKDGSVVARMPQFNVPLLRSHQTIITGKFLTTKSGGTIGVNTEFDGEFNIFIK